MTTATIYQTEFPGRVGAQRPSRVHLVPQVRNHAIQVAALASMLGVELDNWQKWYTKHITGVRADGKWSAYECAMEVPRQNGKTGGIEVLMLYHLFFMPETKKIVYSSHQFKTTKEIFTRIDDMLAAVPALYKLVKVNRGNDNLSIELKNKKSKIHFMARSNKAGRGFAADLLIMDESFALKTSMMAAIMPTMSSRSIAGNPQIIYISSAGFHDSDFQNGIRDRALGENPGNLFYAEWSADEDVDSEDREFWYQTNPALGKRISEEYIWNELQSFRADPEKGEDEWRRERLGIRVRVGAENLFDVRRWDALEDRTQQPTSIMAFAVDVPPSRESASITMTSLLENGDIYMELIDRREGTSWVPERLKQLQQRYEPVAIVCDEYSAAGSLLPDFKKAKIRRIEGISVKEYAQACGDLYDMVHRKDDDEGVNIVHIGQQELHDAIFVAKKSMKGDTAWVLSRKDVSVDISPLVAGVQSMAWLKKKGQRKKTNSGNHMMVLG